jgi:hypothetical protein
VERGSSSLVAFEVKVFVLVHLQKGGQKKPLLMCPPLRWRGAGGEAPNKKDLADLCYDIIAPIFDSTLQTETAMNYNEKQTNPTCSFLHTPLHLNKRF